MSVMRSQCAFPWLVLAAVLSAPACLPYGQPEPSSVAQGRYFATGQPDYDEFFIQLYRLQLDLETTPKKLAADRTRLAAAIGLPTDSDAASFRAKLVAHVNSLRARGVRFQYTREKTVAELQVHGADSGADRDFGQALASAVQSATSARRKSHGWRAQHDQLPPRGVVLERNVEAAFIGESRGTRSDVRQNLSDAQQLLVLMGARLTRIEEQTRELYDALEAALHESPPPPPPEPAPEARPQPNAAKPKARPVKVPDAEAPTAAPPKQGTAKPDFEP
jgi:hypothetical protein